MLIKNITTDEERAFYTSNGDEFEGCRIAGPADGESAFKESRNVKISDCLFELRYPFWHVENCIISNSVMTDTCRAALWYSEGVRIEASKLFGIKVLRECEKVIIKDCNTLSPECGWFCRDIEFDGGYAEGEYFLFHSRNAAVKNLNFKGKYSFQYCRNLTVDTSYLDTKDAFWESENVTVRDSVLKGEYLGWYSKNLTLINCKIVGTQPLCYCENLRLINCETEGCDLSFERSEVDADIVGHIVSIKNPISGSIRYGSTDEIIFDGTCECKCEVTKKEG